MEPAELERKMVVRRQAQDSSDDAAQEGAGVVMGIAPTPHNYTSIYGYDKRAFSVTNSCGIPVGFIKEEIVLDEFHKEITRVYYTRSLQRPAGERRFFSSPVALLKAFGIPLAEGVDATQAFSDTQLRADGGKAASAYLLQPRVSETSPYDSVKGMFDTVGAALEALQLQIDKINDRLDKTAKPPKKVSRAAANPSPRATAKRKEPARKPVKKASRKR